MKVSIVIPIYNVELFVERCLQSVMNQTYHGNLECIIVDDCGLDKSMDIVERMILEYNGLIQFKVIRHVQNRGLSAARNTGMQECSGDYVYFLDSDDEITPDCIEKLTAPLVEERYDIIVGNLKTIGDKMLGRMLSLKLTDKTVLYGNKIQETYRKEWNMMAQNKLYCLDFIRQQRLTFKEGMIHEDELWSLQLSCVAKSLRAVNEITYLYYIRKGSITNSVNKRERKAEMQRIIASEMCNFFKERKILSRPAYKWILFFSSRYLYTYRKNRLLFIQKYKQLHKETRLPYCYRVNAAGWNINNQLKNLLFVIPPAISARLLYFHYNVI